MKIEYSSPLPPSIISISNKTFIVLPWSGKNWVEVPNGTLLSSIEFVNSWQELQKIKTTYKIGIFEEPSSDGKDKYIINSDGETATCNCKGFGFRRKCRHVEKFYIENKI